NLSGTPLVSRPFTVGDLVGVGTFDNIASSSRQTLCSGIAVNTTSVNLFDLTETANGDFVAIAQVNVASAYNPSTCTNARLNGYSYVDLTGVLMRVTAGLTPLWAKDLGTFNGIDFQTPLVPMRDGFA